MTGQYGLIGKTLTHSYSPQIHRQIGNYRYDLFPMEEAAIPAFLREGAWQGLNVTIPYKETVLPYLDEIAPEAQRIGSVNTIVRLPDGHLRGHNTDAFGFAYMLGDSTPLQGKKALVLGSGGASKTVQAVLQEKGIVPVVISRRGENNYANLSRHADAACIVNTTPVGMYPDVDAAPVDLRLFPHCQLVLDLIYNPARTTLLLQAEELGIPGANGIGMLCAQAVRAASLWKACDPLPTRQDIGHIADRVGRDMRSIALIGMPGCGKTSVGQELARQTSRMFIDIDTWIAEKSGKSIPDIFAEEGEQGFRARETQALAQAAKQSHCVIATGGGVVTQPQNLPLLRRNCVILRLTRPIECLSTEGRPLSLSRGVAQLAQEREPLYRAWAEATYENIDLTATARQIREDWA